MNESTAIIIGAGPAGLTAAYELLTRSTIRPLVLERSQYMGGIARTVNYKGNRIDIGGHRFFSKSDRVMQWWLNMLPLEDSPEAFEIAYQGQRRPLTAAQGLSPEETDRLMLVRDRKSRIYFARRFFDYPIRLSADTLRKLGLRRTLRIGFSYLYSSLFPRRPEASLEDFLINRFGRELYLTFFKSYTEKVWGIPCDQLSAEWGAQRIKGLSIRKAVLHALRAPLRRKADLTQKQTETSLIDRFLYPKFGPGQMWETVADEVRRLGGEILTDVKVEKIFAQDGRVTAVEARVGQGPEAPTRRFAGDYFFSTMPVRSLVRGLQAPVPDHLRQIAEGLVYRDFITVGLLLRDLKIRDDTPPGQKLIRDNWIYVQEPDVQVGRIQVFNNWSPYLVRDPDTVWLGLEYFCNTTDTIWNLPDEAMTALAIDELHRIGIVDRSQVLDSVVLRMPKTYPAYVGTYSRFEELRRWLDGFENLFLVGRNGMHRYNNQDHSMLTAMVAVDNILSGRTCKENIWAVNTEMDYHEEKSPADAPRPGEPVAAEAAARP